MTTGGRSCTLTHAEHLATWMSWRDDCAGCGFVMVDVDQCDRGHPDDGVSFCGACGYDKVYNALKVGELSAIWDKAEASGINTDGWSIAETIRAFPLADEEQAKVRRDLEEAQARARAKWTPENWASFRANCERAERYLEATA
jgi:hypothetical protein